jgi:hypothetical protein
MPPWHAEGRGRAREILFETVWVMRFMVRSGACGPRWLALLAIALGSCVYSRDGQSAGLYVDLPLHASTAKLTDRDLGRNFVQLGWRFPAGFMLAGGAYFAGSKHCFQSLTLGRTFARERWQISLTGHGGGWCEIDNRRVRFDRNAGLCTGRLFAFRPRWSFGMGGCVWRHGDYAVGNLALSDHPTSVVADGLQLTGLLLLRFSFEAVPGSAPSRRQAGSSRLRHDE